LACSALSDVALYEYQLAVTLKRVQQTGPPAG
jgi:hypothetical protein